MCGNPTHVSDNKGFSLTELLVVIAIIGIALSITTLGFNQWMTKSKAEAQARQMVTDISQLRIRAMTMKLRHSITLNASSYVFKSYSTDTFTSAATMTVNGTILPGGTYVVNYPLMKTLTTPYAGEIIEVDERGMIVGVGATILLGGPGVQNAAQNCLTVHTIRVNIGKQNATGACDDQ